MTKAAAIIPVNTLFDAELCSSPPDISKLAGLVSCDSKFKDDNADGDFVDVVE